MRYAFLFLMSASAINFMGVVVIYVNIPQEFLH